MIKRNRFYLLVAALTATHANIASGCVQMNTDDLLCSEYPNIQSDGSYVGGLTEYEYDCNSYECYEEDNYSMCECYDWGAWNSYLTPKTMLECCRERFNNDSDIHDCMVLSGGIRDTLNEPPVGSGDSCAVGCDNGRYFYADAAVEGAYYPVATHVFCPKCPTVTHNGTTIQSTSDRGAVGEGECYIPYETSSSSNDGTGNYKLDFTNDCYHPFNGWDTWGSW